MKGPRVLEIIQAVSVRPSLLFSPLFSEQLAYHLSESYFNCDIILWQIDSNTDGLVDFEEFVAATLHIHQMAELDSERWGLRCQAAFSKFDLDGDGYITPDELRMVSFNSCSVFMLVYVATSYLVNEVILSTEDIISYTKKENPRFSHMLVDAPHSRGLSHTYRRPV